jgi:hypothetical protein
LDVSLCSEGERNVREERPKTHLNGVIRPTLCTDRSMLDALPRRMRENDDLALQSVPRVSGGAKAGLSLTRGARVKRKSCWERGRVSRRSGSGEGKQEETYRATASPLAASITPC